MKEVKSQTLDDEILETVSGGKTTDIHKFYSASSKELIGTVTIVDGKVKEISGTIPDKWRAKLGI